MCPGKEIWIAQTWFLCFSWSLWLGVSLPLHHWQLCWVTPCSGHCPVYCRMFSSTLGLYALDANSTPPTSVTVKNVCRHCWMSSGGQNCSGWKLQHQWVECSPTGWPSWLSTEVLSAGRNFPFGAFFQFRNHVDPSWVLPTDSMDLL